MRLTKRALALCPWLFAVGCTVAVSTGCGSSSSAAAQKEITIGMSAPLTGALGQFGVGERKGALLAVKEINSSKFLGNTKLKLNFVDNRGDTATSVSQFHTYNSDSTYAAVLCCTTSDEAGALKPLAVKGSTPTVIMDAAAPGLPQPPNFVRITYNTTAPGGLFSQSIDHAAQQWKPKTAVLEVSSDSALNAAPQTLKTWKDALAKNGVKLLATINTSINDTDFSGAASSTVAKNPDLVVFDVQADRAPLLARALQRAGYKGKKLGNYSMTSPTLYSQAGSAFDGLTLAAVFSPLFSNPQAKSFVSQWNKEGSNPPPDVFAANAYIAVKFVAQAIKDAGITGDRKKIAAAMAKITSFDTPEGTITLKDGDASFTGTPTFLQWNKGQLQVVHLGS